MGMMLLAVAVLWALYLFPKDPSIYWKGIQLVNQDRGSDPYFYLMGELRPRGWNFYFVIAWLVKTPIPTLLLSGAGLVMLLRGRRAHWLDEAFLFVPAVSYFIFYSVFADNIGVRYLIPCFPFLFISAGRLVPVVERASLLRKLLLGAMLAWSLSEYLTIMPDHLSYFNQVAGGAAGGMEWLDHSNLDWGQGLIQLQKFIQGKSDRRLCLFLFWNCRPRVLRHPRPPDYGLRISAPADAWASHSQCSFHSEGTGCPGPGLRPWTSELVATSKADPCCGAFPLRLRDSLICAWRFQ